MSKSQAPMMNYPNSNPQLGIESLGFHWILGFGDWGLINLWP